LTACPAPSPQVLETDGLTNATAALGRVVIDLSQFASIDGQELRTFTVSF
jgi:hypothetical protein